MRHLTLEYIHKLILSKPKMEASRRPSPMPGRKWPTRVAWSITLMDKRLVGEHTDECHWELRNKRTFSYLGKPNRYRALQAHKIWQDASSDKIAIMESWQAEFDREGLVAYSLGLGGKPFGAATGAFYAYHPHSSRPEIIEAFTKPLHLKRVGVGRANKAFDAGMWLYSQKRKLAQEAVDAYYEWYAQQFGRKLRRPKPQITEASTDTPPVLPAPAVQQ